MLIFNNSFFSTLLKNLRVAFFLLCYCAQVKRMAEENAEKNAEKNNEAKFENYKPVLLKIMQTVRIFQGDNKKYGDYYDQN